MINILVPVLNEEMLAFAKSLTSLKDAKIIIGTTKQFESHFSKDKNITVKVFEEKSKKEEIINSLKRYMTPGKILICRKVLTLEEVDKFVSSTSDITICKGKERNKASQFFARLWNSLMRFMFGFTFFEGDPSAICFSEKFYDVICSLGSLSYVSRVNRWRGLSIGTVATKAKAQPQEYNKVASNFMLVGWIVLFLATIVSTALYIYYVGPFFLAAFLWTCGILLAEVGMLIAIAIYVMNVKVGSRKFGDAKLMEEVL